MEEYKPGFFGYLFIYGKYIFGIVFFIAVFRGCGSSNDNIPLPQQTESAEERNLKLGTQAMTDKDYSRGIEYLSKIPSSNTHYADAQSLIKWAKISLGDTSTGTALKPAQTQTTYKFYPAGQFLSEGNKLYTGAGAKKDPYGTISNIEDFEGKTIVTVTTYEGQVINFTKHEFGNAPLYVYSGDF